MFSLSGKGSEIKCNIFPPLELKTTSEWEIGLVNLTTYNSIPNIETDVNDTLYLGNVTKSTTVAFADGRTAETAKSSSDIYSIADKTILDSHEDGVSIKLPEGAYELEDLERYIVETCRRSKINVDFKLKANNNTLKSEIYCSRPVDFVQPSSIGPMLGFEPRVLEPNKWHVSDHEVNIIRVNIIRIVCNIVRGAYDNGVENHILHEFALAVDPGYKIIETPTNVIYLPVNTNRVHTILVRLEDQDGRLVNLRNEIVSLRLHLRQRHGSCNTTTSI